MEERVEDREEERVDTLSVSYREKGVRGNGK